MSFTIVTPKNPDPAALGWSEKIARDERGLAFPVVEKDGEMIDRELFRLRGEDAPRYVRT